jgi:hypothetical protein
MKYEIDGKYLDTGNRKPTLVNKVDEGTYYKFTTPDGYVNKWSAKVVESALDQGTWTIMDFPETLKVGDSFVFRDDSCSASDSPTKGKIYTYEKDIDGKPDMLRFINDEGKSDWQYKKACLPVPPKSRVNDGDYFKIDGKDDKIHLCITARKAGNGNNSSRITYRTAQDEETWVWSGFCQKIDVDTGDDLVGKYFENISNKPFFIEEYDHHRNTLKYVSVGDPLNIYYTEVSYARRLLERKVWSLVEVDVLGILDELPATGVWQSYDPYAENYRTAQDEEPMAKIPTTKQEEEPMTNNELLTINVSQDAFAVTETTTIYGFDVGDMNEQDLFNSLTQVQADVSTLEALETGELSKRITSKIAALKLARIAIITLIDKRAS